MTFQDLTDGVLKACRSTFGEDVTYTPTGDSAVTVQGVFDLNTLKVEDGLPILTNDPRVLIRKADIAADFEPTLETDLVTIRSVAYKVVDYFDDGRGGVTLDLKRVS